MANREALKELQLRLAARLQAARTEERAVAAWLAAECGARRVLFPLAQAGEIFAWHGVQSVPYTQPWFLGVANLRGVLTGVVDLAMLLGDPPTRTAQGLTEAGLLTLASAFEVNAALLIDRFAGLRNAQAFVATETAAPESPVCLGAIHVDEQGLRWQEVDLQLLAQDAAFLGIGA